MCYNAIAGGEQNRITGASCFSMIFGQCLNLIAGYDFAVIIGGCNAGGNYLSAGGNYTTTVNHLIKTGGTFSIKHPDPAKFSTHYLTHSHVESPGGGDNVYRFRVTTQGCHASLTLPDYYRWLNKETHVHVQPVDTLSRAHGEPDAALTKVDVHSTEEGTFDVVVIGRRNDEFVQRAHEGDEFIP